MSAGRVVKVLAVLAAALSCVLTTLVFAVPAGAGTGVGASGNTIVNAAQAQSPFTAGTFDSGQPIDVVVPANSVLTPGANIFILECAAPGGVNPTTSGSCDGNTGYQGGTISVQADGSIDVINTSTSFGTPYTVYALPDAPTLHESPSSTPACGLGSANECVLYIGQGGGGDTGFAQPHFFSQAFQVHPDPTDSGTLTPGDGTFPADSAPAITSANHATFSEGAAGSFSVTATGYGPPTFTETGTLPTGATLKTTFSGNSSTGVLAGTPTVSGSFPITLTADNGVGTAATQSFTLTVNGAGTAPTITSANTTTFTKGTAGTFTVTATGSPAPPSPRPARCPPGSPWPPGACSPAPRPPAALPDHHHRCQRDHPQRHPELHPHRGCGTGDHLCGLHQLHRGAAGTFTVTATGFPAPTFSEAGSLPGGVTLSTGGVLSGTPTVSGPFPITITAANGITPNATQSFTLTVVTTGVAPAITSVNHATFTEGAAGTFTVTATGSPAPTFSETGSLPTGVLFSSAGVLSGTPTASGSFPVTITAANGITPNATQSFTLTVNAAPAITSAAATTFTEGTAGTFTVTATGFPAPSFTEAGTLPAGVTLSTAGLLSGTPTATGPFPVTITAANGVTPNATQSFTLDVDAPPAITSVNHATFNAGTAGTFTATATGFPPPTFTETGALPAGVTLTTGGVLSGTASAGGSFPITITAANGVTPNATQSFTLTVDAAPAITSAALTTFTEGTAGTFTVTATGFPAPSFTEAGTLPAGVTLSTGGVLSGTPTASGPFPITITAANGITPNATQSFTLTVSTTGVAPIITSVNHATFTKGTAGTFTVTATGSPAPTFSETGSLPTGVLFSSAGVLSGTPTASGSFPVTITAANGITPNATQSFTLTVNAAPAITSAAATTFTEGTAGTFTVTATGFPAPSFTEAGTLPAGVTLSTGGVLSGTPTASGPFPITITAANGITPNATQSFTLTVSTTGVAPTITSANHTTFTEGIAGSFTVTATGFPSPTFTEIGPCPAESPSRPVACCRGPRRRAVRSPSPSTPPTSSERWPPRVSP